MWRQSEFVKTDHASLITHQGLSPGAIGLDGGYETHVACRGSVTT